MKLTVLGATATATATGSRHLIEHGGKRLLVDCGVFQGPRKLRERNWRIVQVERLSAHADHHEMIGWLRASRLAPRRVFVTHGEPAAAGALGRRLRKTFAWDAVVPDFGAAFEL